MNDYKADKQTAEWLKQNGWDEKSFTVIELPFHRPSKSHIA